MSKIKIAQLGSCTLDITDSGLDNIIGGEEIPNPIIPIVKGLVEVGSEAIKGVMLGRGVNNINELMTNPKGYDVNGTTYSFDDSVTLTPFNN